MKKYSPNRRRLRHELNAREVRVHVEQCQHIDWFLLAPDFIVSSRALMGEIPMTGNVLASDKNLFWLIMAFL